MAKTYARFTSTGGDGKVSSTTIYNVNPEASNTQLVNFAIKLNALTTRDYNSTTRINEIDCDTESSKLTPTLTLAANVVSRTDENYFETISGTNERLRLSILVTYNGNGTLYVPFASSGGAENIAFRKAAEANSYVLEVTWKTAEMSSDVIRLSISATETDTYKAALAYLTINP